MKRTHVAIAISAIILVGLAVTLAYFVTRNDKTDRSAVVDFAGCAKDERSTITETYPSVCTTVDGQRFIEPTNGNPAPTPSNSDSYIGLTETEAIDKAARENTPARVVERDGESLMVDMSYIEGRLGFYVKDGKVFKVTVEGQ